MLTPHITCETTYAKDNQQPKIVWIELSAYAIKIIKCRALHFQGPGSDVISKDPLRVSATLEMANVHDRENHAQCFVIDANGHVTVLNELVNGEQSIVWLSRRGRYRNSSLGIG